MKAFINDWLDDSENYTEKEENKEYPINEWITDVDGSRAYLVSAYVYDNFIMFFYLYDAEIQTGTFSFHVNHEINHLGATRASGTETLMIQEEEYNYLNNLVKESQRIPKDLEGKELAFKKFCLSFEKPVKEINHLVVYPEIHRFNRHKVGKTFKVPYGEGNHKVFYTIPDTGEESYIIVKELKFHNMLESFDANYEKHKKVHEKALRDFEENKEKYGKNQVVLSLDEMRSIFDVTLITLTLLCPKEKRSFELRTSSYLNRRVSMARAFLFRPDKDDLMEGDLYKSVVSLGEVSGEPEKEYEIILESVTDSYHIEKIPLLIKSFETE